MLLAAQSASEFCYFCKKRVYIMERQAAEGVFFHRHCFKCDYCGVGLRLNTYSCERPQGDGGEQGCCSFGCNGSELSVELLMQDSPFLETSTFLRAFFLKLFFPSHFHANKPVCHGPTVFQVSFFLIFRVFLKEALNCIAMLVIMIMIIKILLM